MSFWSRLPTTQRAQPIGDVLVFDLSRMKRSKRWARPKGVAMALSVPQAREWFCSLLCVECIFFGSYRCRWCGEYLSASGQRFCDDACRHQSQSVRFGDGTRTMIFLARFHPHLYRRLGGQRCCLRCGDPLLGKQSTAEFCGDRCRKAHRRAALLATLQESGKRADTAPSNQQLTDADFESRPLVPEMSLTGLSRTRFELGLDGKGSAD